MKINIRNQARLPNRYLRFIKWKIYQLKEKFDHLIYAEIHLRAEGTRTKEYKVNVRLGIPGNDIILKNKSTNLHRLLNQIPDEAHRYLAKSKPQI